MLDGDCLNRRPHFHFFLHRRSALQRTIKTGPADSRPADTCARCLSCLAKASLLGFRRRCPLATDAALLASSLDFLQGTFEKIQFQRLVRQHPLQLADFLPERGLTRVPRRRSSSLWPKGIQLIPPLVQKPPMYVKFLRQCHDVIAGLQSLHRHPAELLRIFRNSSLCHLQLPFPAKCAIPCVSR